ncbi:nucleotide exchange factor GrpE [Agrilactobacillus fermenti]|uniref:nucleotide exchange factor GrpE n=1 Tax=Agrilactobacillus fermenti TaxID=2586909 RepID=UPI0038B3E434
MKQQKTKSKPEPEAKSAANEQTHTTASKSKNKATEAVASDKASDQSETDQALKTLQTKYDALEDQFLRAQAEIRNMSNRHKKEQEQLAKYDGQRLAKDILPAIDNLERALAVEVDNDSGQQLKKGIEMVYKDMQKALTDNHITEIKALGEKFDPTLHQAVQTVPKTEAQKADTVVQVYQRGYQLKDRVIRPAMVVVAQ